MHSDTRRYGVAALALGLMALGTTPLPAQSTRRAKPAGSGVPAAAIPVARAQPNSRARDMAILTSAPPMALPDGEASGAPASASSRGGAMEDSGLDPRVFRVDPRDEIVIVSPLEAPPVDYGNGTVITPPPAEEQPQVRTPVARRSSIPPPAITRITIEPAAPPGGRAEDTPAAPGRTRITIKPAAPTPEPEPEVAQAPLPPPVPPDPELDKRSAKRSRARAVRDGTVATLAPSDLVEFSRQPARVKYVIKNALALTDMGLDYKFGSADPSSGGLDCSGAIYACLQNSGLQSLPRDSFSQYEWLVEQGKFNPARAGGFGRFSLDKLKPGDLLFWINTYKTNRNPPVTHVAIYLGREKSTGQYVMMHAGNGRKYNGKSRRGVTVATLDYPDKIGMRGGQGSFIGWGSVPGVR